MKKEEAEKILFSKEQVNQIDYLDIGLVKSKGFLAKAIQFFMKRYARSRGVKPDRYYNHAFLIVNMWDTKWVAEAKAEGYVLTPFVESYLGRDNFKIGRVKNLRVTKKLVAEVSREAAQLSFKQTRYDVMNFFWQIIKSYTGQWFRNDIDITKTLYCTEAVAHLVNMMKPGIFVNPGEVNPLDIDINPNIEWVIDYIKDEE